MLHVRGPVWEHNIFHMKCLGGRQCIQFPHIAKAVFVSNIKGILWMIFSLKTHLFLSFGRLRVADICREKCLRRESWNILKLRIITSHLRWERNLWPTFWIWLNCKKVCTDLEDDYSCLLNVVHIKKFYTNKWIVSGKCVLIAALF